MTEEEIIQELTEAIQYDTMIALEEKLKSNETLTLLEHDFLFKAHRKFYETKE